MSHDELMRALTTERYGQPVREWKPQDRSRPLAERLDDHHALQTYLRLAAVEEAS